MDKYILTGLDRAGNWNTLAKCDSLAEAVRLQNEYRTTRGVRRYEDYGIKYP